jgi:hypothetical protein
MLHYPILSILSIHVDLPLVYKLWCMPYLTLMTVSQIEFIDLDPLDGLSWGVFQPRPRLMTTMLAITTTIPIPIRMSLR